MPATNGRLGHDGAAFEGNRAETTTMGPTIRAFMAAHQLTDVTIVADAGMISDSNKRAIQDAGLSFILGARSPQGHCCVDGSVPAQLRPGDTVRFCTVSGLSSPVHAP